MTGRGQILGWSEASLSTDAQIKHRHLRFVGALRGLSVFDLWSHRCISNKKELYRGLWMKEVAADSHRKMLLMS